MPLVSGSIYSICFCVNTASSSKDEESYVTIMSKLEQEQNLFAFWATSLTINDSPWSWAIQWPINVGDIHRFLGIANEMINLLLIWLKSLNISGPGDLLKKRPLQRYSAFLVRILWESLHFSAFRVRLDYCTQLNTLSRWLSYLLIEFSHE